MPGNISVPREDEDYGSVITVKRSRLFFTVPVIIILIITLYFVWEIIRENLSSQLLVSWPFRFTVVNASTAATVLAVFISLFMGRLQWARALRPTVGLAIDDDGAKFLQSSSQWRLWIYNAGPGGAVIDSITYCVRFADQPEGDGVYNWVPLSVVNDQLRSRGLVDGTDYFIRWYGHGAPFPAVSRYSDGMQLAWFNVQALAQIRILDVCVRYVDSLGDIHEKTIPIVQRMPSVAMAAIKNVSPKIIPNP